MRVEVDPVPLSNRASNRETQQPTMNAGPNSMGVRCSQCPLAAVSVSPIERLVCFPLCREADLATATNDHTAGGSRPFWGHSHVQVVQPLSSQTVSKRTTSKMPK